MQRQTLLLDGNTVVRASLANGSTLDATHDRACAFASNRPRNLLGGNGRRIRDDGRSSAGGRPAAHGMAAEDLVAPEDRYCLARALRRAGVQGETWFLFRDAQSGTRWLGHLESLCEEGALEEGERRLLVWTWEPVPPECLVLTTRQREILLAVLDGRSAAQVARHLGIAPSTVRTHLQRCQCAARCANHVSLIAWAHRHRRVLELLEG